MSHKLIEMCTDLIFIVRPKLPKFIKQKWKLIFDYWFICSVFLLLNYRCIYVVFSFIELSSFTDKERNKKRR